MKQKEFSRVLQKYASGRGTDKERRMVEQWYENLQSPKDIEDSLMAKSQIFKNINEKLGRSGKMRRRRQLQAWRLFCWRRSAFPFISWARSAIFCRQARKMTPIRREEMRPYCRSRSRFP